MPSLFPLLRFLLVRLVAGEALRFLDSDPFNKECSCIDKFTGFPVFDNAPSCL